MKKTMAPKMKSLMMKEMPMHDEMHGKKVVKKKKPTKAMTNTGSIMASLKKLKK